MTKDKLASWLPDALMLSGAGAVSAGAGMVYLPAGWIVAGAFSMAFGWMVARGVK